MRKKRKMLFGILFSLALVLGMMAAMSVTVYATSSTVATKITSEDLNNYTGYDKLPGWTSLSMDERDTVSGLPQTGEVWLVFGSDGFTTSYVDGVVQTSFPLSWSNLPYQINTMGKQVYYPKLVHTHDDITYQPWTSTDSLPTEPGNYYLTKDVTYLGTWTAPTGTTNLCLNGHTVLAYGNYNEMIKVNNDAVLNILDEAENAGKITCDGGMAIGVYGGTVVMKGGSIENCTWGSVNIYKDGSFTMEDGFIQNNDWNNAGAGMCVNQGTFTMNGGSINDNTCSSYSGGGGVYIANGSTFEMNGGSIKGNAISQSDANGGGVFVGYRGKFKMTGGCITENKSVGRCGGVYVADNGAIELSGNAEIYDNAGDASGSPRTENVYLADDRIVITGEMTNTKPIGVDVEPLTGGVFTRSGEGVKASDYVDKFTSEKAGFVVKADGDELKLAREEAFSYLDADGMAKTVDTYAYLSDVNLTAYWVSLSEGWYVVDKEYEATSKVNVNGKVKLILCDDAVLNATKGFVVENDGSTNSALDIYATSTKDNAGRLIASGEEGYPGIGGSYGICGSVNIYGGNIKVNGGKNAAAIGGRWGRVGGVTRIYGGTLEATAGEGTAAIGAGVDCDDHGLVFLGKDISVSAGADADHTEDVTATFADKHDQAYVKTKVRESEAFDGVVEAVDALPAGKDITTGDKAAIEAARKAYNDLDAAQKAKVPTKSLKKLEAAEAVLASLERADTAEKAGAEAVKAQKEAKDAQAKAENAQKVAEAAAAQAGADKEAIKAAQAKAEKSQKAAEAKAAAAEKALKESEKALKTAEKAQAKAEDAQEDAEKKADKAKENSLKPLGKAKLLNGTKGGKKKITVKWKKVKGARGYQITLTKKKKVTTYTVKGGKKTSVVIKKLKKGKYKVTVRAYKTYKGNTVYGKASNAKVVKVKRK